jgi:hypothetical protein
MTIAIPATGETSEAQLEEDTFHMLWLVHRNREQRPSADPALGRPAERLAHREDDTGRAGAARGARVREREGAVTAQPQARYCAYAATPICRSSVPTSK